PRRGFGAFSDSAHEQRDDEGNDGHLERVQPDRSDETCNREKVAPHIFGEVRGKCAKREADEQSGERPIGAKSCAAVALAQRGFLNLSTTRSVLPRIFGSKTSR